MRKFNFTSLFFLSLATAINPAWADQPKPAQRSTEVISKTYYVDQKYTSMRGPMSSQSVFLSDDAVEYGEIYWITGYEAVMVGGDGKTPMSQEFMCHSNLDFDIYAHRKYFPGIQDNYSLERVFTLSQGQYKIDFPEGFGIPVVAHEPLTVETQVLNLNLEDEEFEVRHKVTIHYVRDRDLEIPLKPLFPKEAFGLKSVEAKSAHYGLGKVDEEKHGPGCLPGKSADPDYDFFDQYGRRFTPHWVVEPGREVNQTLVTKILSLPFDTTIHYIAVHLHPFAESLELVDRTTGKTLFKSAAKNLKKKIGLKHVEYFNSVDGIPVYQNHEYEIISVYNNTSGENQDAMAVMYLYLYDEGFQKYLLQKQMSPRL